MTKRFTDGIFALGLVCGGALAIIALVWLIGLNYCPGAPCAYGESIGPEAVSAPEANPADNPTHEKYYEHQDLRAQEAMARATNWIVWLTTLSTFLGLLGAALLFWTLSLTRQANFAAQEAVRVTREVGRDQSRAYVHVKSIRWLEHRDNFEFTVFIENTGHTPVKRFQIGATVEVADYETFPEGCIPKAISENGWNALPSKEVFQLTLKPLPKPDYGTIANRSSDKSYILVRGLIRYVTYFNETFETEFSFMGHGRGITQKQYPEYGSLGTKMSRTTENTRVFVRVDD